jgi:UDP:flavonoid glycosyltransferase YjiC (YdhE family)
VLASGWGGLKLSDLPDTVHQVTSLPHIWLFPRMAAVVHHGGAGTTAASLRAGVPTVIVPFMGDQPFWGQRVADLGVGPMPIPRKQLTARRLAQAIVECVSNVALRRKAEDLGQKIRAEDGIGNAVAMVDRIARKT